MRYFLLLFIFSFSVTSCISTSKFNDLESKNEFLVEENLNLKNAKKSETEFRAKNAELEYSLQTTEDLLKSLNAKYNGMKTSYAQLQLEYDKLSSQNRNILSTTAGEKTDLEQELASKQNELDRKARELAEKEKNLDLQTTELSAMNTTIAERESQINELNASLEQQKFILQDLKFRISSALSSFSASELQVEQKPNGKVYISMSQELLFVKGSNKVDEKGKTALQKLAEVLKQNKDIDILIEGHTDSDGSAARNWDLSVTRATEVVKILQDAGVEPKQMTASGKAFYMPKVENDSEDNKALNRRTEIILSPKLDKLFELIQNK